MRAVGFGRHRCCHLAHILRIIVGLHSLWSFLSPRSASCLAVAAFFARRGAAIAAILLRTLVGTCWRFRYRPGRPGPTSPSRRSAPGCCTRAARGACWRTVSYSGKDADCSRRGAQLLSVACLRAPLAASKLELASFLGSGSSRAR